MWHVDRTIGRRDFIDGEVDARISIFSYELILDDERSFKISGNLFGPFVNFYVMLLHVFESQFACEKHLVVLLIFLLLFSLVCDFDFLLLLYY